MSDRRPLSPTELAQLERCEQQMLYDRRFGAKRSAHWQKRSAEGRIVHEQLHRQAMAPDRRKVKPMFLLAALAALLVALFLLASARGTSTSDAQLPEELRGAKLHLSEKTLVRKKPVHVRGRPDEVWVKDGQRYIIESKSRGGGVYAADRMQLAAYAYLMRTDGSSKLAPHGYIRFTGGEETTFAKVKLKDDEAVIAAHQRYRDVERGKVDLRFASSAALCRGCGHKARCPNSRAA